MKKVMVLENWFLYFTSVVGEIYNDTRGNFPDGTVVRTSAVDFEKSGEPVTWEKGSKVYTRNSVYVLGEEVSEEDKLSLF